MNAWSRLFRLLVAALLSVAGVVVPVSAAAAPTDPAPTDPAPTVPALSWADCAQGFQCATAQVPLDYSRPAGATISLALIRLPAGDPTHRIGSLFLNPGGPGGSGVDFVRFAASIFPAEVRA